MHKYRHSAMETLSVRTAELAVLAELLMRGPQTLGNCAGGLPGCIPWSRSSG